MKSATEVRYLVYNAVSTSAKWLLDRAGPDGNFIDEYIGGLGSEIGTPMPIAECIMALLNLKESEYLHLEIQSLQNEDAEKLANQLLDSVEKYKLIGLPYVRPPKGEHDPEFVDALNYVLGAVAKLVRLHTKDKTLVLSPTTVKRLEAKGRELVELLLKWRRDYRVGGVTRYAWSWTGDEAADSVRPPSLFFTCQAATTLLEVLFEAPTLLGDADEGLASRVMTALTDAKKYIVESLQWTDNPDQIGWVNINLDYIQAPAGRTAKQRERLLQDKGYPHFQMGSYGDPRISLYAIECLAFFQYYQTEKFFSQRRERLRADFSEDWKEFSGVASESIRHMGSILERFLSMMESPGQSNSINFEPIKIELPSGLNESNDDDGGARGSWYFDGTTPYTALSALTFGSEQFGFRFKGEASQSAGGVSESHILRLAEFIVEKAFDGTCFLHLQGGKGASTKGGLRAIYATGAAIEPLLSIELQRPEAVSLSGSEEARVRKLVLELVATLRLGVRDKPSAVDGVLRVSEIRGLLSVAFCLGIVTNFFSDEKTFSNPRSGKGKNKPFWNAKLTHPPFDLERLVQINGVELIDLLAHVGARGEGSRIEELASTLAVEPYLLDVTRSWLTTAKIGKAEDGGLRIKEPGEIALAKCTDANAVVAAATELVDRLVIAAREEQRDGLAQQLSAVRNRVLG